MSSVKQIREELDAFYKSYEAAFRTEDVAPISEYFACPCAFVTGQGLNQFATAGDVQGVLGKFLADLKERGWARSVINRLKTWALADDLAMILVDGTRYKADGSVLETVRACYNIRRDGNNWKIVTVSIVQPPFLGPGDLPR